MTLPPDISRSEPICLRPPAVIFTLMALDQILSFFGMLVGRAASALLPVGPREQAAMYLANHSCQAL